MTLSPGEVSDVKGYSPVMDEPGPVPKILIADKGQNTDRRQGYDSDAIRDDLTARGVTSVIPPNRRNGNVQEPVDGFIYALRNRIERCFAKLKQNRRIATRYDKTANSYLGFAVIGALRLWIRHFVNTA
jgi:transposase